MICTYVVAIRSLSRSEQVKTLLAGPSPISPMKAKITISPISNILTKVGSADDNPTSDQGLATVWPVDTSRPLAIPPDDLKIRKLRGGIGVQSTNHFDQDRNNFEDRLGLPFWHSGTHCDKISHRIAHSLPQQRVIYRKPFPNLEPSAIFLIEMASTKWR